MDYRMKAVFFDVLAECKELKHALQSAGVLVLSPFFGIRITEVLQQEAGLFGVSLEDCLFLTNKEQHAKEAKALGMVAVGCVEGHFEIPKTSTLLESPEEISVSYLDRVFCHEKKLPAMVLETPRLFVRELTGQDMDALYEILTEEETARFLPSKAGAREEELEKLVSYVSCVYSFFEYGYWGVFLKETGELIGRAGFKEGSFPPEAGYVIKRPLWGNGFGTEVLEHLVGYARDEIGCEEVYARIDRRNTASVRVAEKCGFLEVKENKEEPETEQGVLLFQYCM